MPRPVNITDIELKEIEIAKFAVDAFSTDGKILKHYGQFIESMQSAGHTVESFYGGVKVLRTPNLKEQHEQLASNQALWDVGEKWYEHMRDIGRCENSYEESAARRWAEAEGLPWPPTVEPIQSVDVVIRDIESLASQDA